MEAAPSWRLALVVAVAPALLSAADPPQLSRADEAALLTAACSWADDSKADVAKRRCAAPSDLEWSSARPGRFVQGDGEWLVSLAGPCIRGCPGVTFIARRTGGRWTTVGGDEQLVTESCVTVRGFADGLDRVACAGAAGPHQGSMAVFVDVRRYAEDASDDRLLYKEHGGECFFAEPPATAEFDDDELSALSPGDAGSDTALTVRLTVRRAECDRSVENPEARATVRGEHVLRFVKRGNEVVPDAATAALVEQYGWRPAR